MVVFREKGKGISRLPQTELWTEQGTKRRRKRKREGMGREICRRNGRECRGGGAAMGEEERRNKNRGRF